MQQAPPPPPPLSPTASSFPPTASQQPQQHTSFHYPSSSSPGYSNLPPGWEVVRSPAEDGRMYYWDRGSSGRTTWAVHPSDPRIPYLLDTPLNATRRPSSHQCKAVVAFLLFPPLGLCALMHSCLVDRCWNSGRYGDAVNHSRQAHAYANFSNFVGVILWIWLLFFREGPPLVTWDDIKRFFTWR